MKVPDVISLDGIPELKKALAKKARQVIEGAERAVAEELELVKEDAKANAAVRSGAMREGIESDAIEAEALGVTGEVRTTSKHSAANEFGTSRMAAHPFMTPAAERSRVRFPEGAAKSIKEAVR